MKSFSVSSRGLGSVEVEAGNWVTALGLGLDQFDKADNLQRLACELLPNGTVIARDIASGMGYIVQPMLESEGASEQVEDLDLIAAPADDDEDDIAVESGDDYDDIEVEPDETGELELVELDMVQLEADDDTLDQIEASETRHAACQLALQVARELVPAESGAVILQERGFLRFISVVGPHSRTLLGVRLPQGTGVAGFAMQKRRTVVLANATEDPRHCGEVDALTGYTTRQIVVIPVVSDGEVEGVIELMNLPAEQRFTRQDVENVEQVAEALAKRLGRD